MAKMPELIEEFRKKIHAKREGERQKAEKAKHLLKEAREYYGYHVETRDPRFTKMLEEKEARAEEEKKVKSKERRQAKQLQMIMNLQEKAVKDREAALKKEEEQRKKEEEEKKKEGEQKQEQEASSL